MANRQEVIGAFVAILLAAGVIATLLAVLMVDNGSSTQQPLNGDTVYLKTGQENFNFKGKIPTEGAMIFTGIPFSDPPKGEFRWQKPRPPSPLTYDGDYYDATYFRPGCAQLCKGEYEFPEYFCPSEISEDCLYLTVYVPTKLMTTLNTNEGYTLVENIKLPVMVFIYGGTFVTGGDGAIIYDARFIAEKGDVVVVVPNYRLGPFGFFYQNSSPNGESALGNFGIWDQISALQWVKENIIFFGGNSEKITIFGQSAGAQSVAVHLVNNYSNPFFHQAILESNPLGINYKTTAEAQDMGNKFARHLNCSANDMNCLRGISMDNVLEGLKSFPLKEQFNNQSFSQTFEPWAPILDDDLLTQHPYYYFKQGLSQQKPIIHGTTTNEAMYFVEEAFPLPVQDSRVYKLLLTAIFGSNDTLVEKQYPAECPAFGEKGDCDDRRSMDVLVTDLLFTCIDRRVFNTPNVFESPDLQVWWYTFDQIWSFPEFWGSSQECANLTCHSAELPYLFNNDKLTEFTFTEEESVLADKLIYYWTNFAKYANPNAPSTRRNLKIRSIHKVKQRHFSSLEMDPPSVKYWPRLYENSNGRNTVSKTIRLSGSGETILENFKEEKCNFWDNMDVYLEDSIKLGVEMLVR